LNQFIFGRFKLEHRPNKLKLLSGQPLCFVNQNYSRSTFGIKMAKKSLKADS